MLIIINGDHSQAVAIDFSIRRIYSKRSLALSQLFIGDNFEFCLGICYVCGLEKEKH